jgi:hypothetical protein
MRIITLIITLFTLFCLTSSFQCNKCRSGDLRLDNTRSWFPLKGKTSLPFFDNAGVLANFNLLVKDTSEIIFNECGESYNAESIKTTLYLNATKTDSIHFSLNSNGWLCMYARSGNNPDIGMCNVFGQVKAGIVAKRFYNLTVGARSYQEVILLLQSPGLPGNIDSVFIANNVGIVGFNYSTKKFTLQ